MEANESREARLVRVVQKLETKVKVIWDEKKALAERLELATLDKELAEERYLAAQAELHSESEFKAKLEARVAELEELQALSVELEDSYVAQKEELSVIIEDLRRELAAATAKAEHDAQLAEARINALLASQTSEQSVETLRQELVSTKLQLAASELDLSVQRLGMADALRPIFAKDAPNYVDTLPFIDYYVLATSLRESFDKFRVGDISARMFAHAIDAQVCNAEDNYKALQPDWDAAFKLFRSVGRTSAHLNKVLNWLKSAPAVPPRIQEMLQMLVSEVNEDLDVAVLARLEQEVEQVQSADTQTEPAATTELADESSAQPRELEALKLRIRFLESKLSQAKDLAAEIDALKTWQVESRGRESQLQRVLADVEEASKHKDYEIAKLKRAELPTTLDAAVVQQRLRAMSAALQWFSRSQHRRLTLDPLEHAVPRRISTLTGNACVSALRKAVLDFGLVDTSAVGDSKPRRLAGRIALDQYEAMVRLGCAPLLRGGLDDKHHHDGPLRDWQP